MNTKLQDNEISLLYDDSHKQDFSVEQLLQEWLDKYGDDEIDFEIDDDNDGNVKEELEVALVDPYMEDEFRQWLMEKRAIAKKSAGDYLRAYRSTYEQLYINIGIDLYDTLDLLFSIATDSPDNILSRNLKNHGPLLVKIYVDAMEQQMEGKEVTDKKEKARQNAGLRALKAYHAFIADECGNTGRRLLKPKAKPLPDEEIFITWLEKECRQTYGNACKIVSSIKLLDLILPSFVSEPMTFLDVLRAAPDKKRGKYIKYVCNRIHLRGSKKRGKHKTIANCLANTRTFYINFLNSQSQS